MTVHNEVGQTVRVKESRCRKPPRRTLFEIKFGLTNTLGELSDIRFRIERFQDILGKWSTYLYLEISEYKQHLREQNSGAVPIFSVEPWDKPLHTPKFQSAVMFSC